MVETSRKVGLAIMFLLPVFGRLALPRSEAAEDQPDSGESNVLAEFSIDTDGAPIVLEVEVEPARESFGPKPLAKTCHMLLETGATHTFFHPNHRAMLGMIPNGNFARSGPAGEERVDAYAAPSMRLGDIALHSNGNVACLDIEWWERGIGRKLDGVIGIDVLRSMVFSIDFDKGKLRFHKSIGPDFGSRVAICWDGEPGAERPYIWASIDGRHRQDFIIDTGAPGNMSGALQALDYEWLCKQQLLKPLVGGARAVPLQTPYGETKVAIGRAKSLVLGGHTHEGLIFGKHPRASSLGLGYLSRYSVAFDFPNNVMYLRPGKQFAKRDVWYDNTSFTISKSEAGVVVDKVYRGVTTIKPGDLLISINGRSARDLTLFAIRRMLATETRQELRMSREGVTLEDVLDYSAEVRRVAAESGDDVDEAAAEELQTR